MTYLATYVNVGTKEILYQKYKTLSGSELLDSFDNHYVQTAHELVDVWNRWGEQSQTKLKWKYALISN